MDAVRVRDGCPVVLKQVSPEEGPYELEINRLFSSSELPDDPRDHCAPLLDLIELQGSEYHKIMIFPLPRPFNSAQFQTVGEFVAFFTQICEVILIFAYLSSRHNSRLVAQGIQFMHKHNVAHRCKQPSLVRQFESDSSLRDCTATHGERV